MNFLAALAILVHAVLAGAWSTPAGPTPAHGVTVSPAPASASVAPAPVRPRLVPRPEPHPTTPPAPAPATVAEPGNGPELADRMCYDPIDCPPGQ